MRSHNSDEEEDGFGKKWVVIRRKSTHDSQMKAKMRVVYKTCHKQFEERAMEEKQKFVVYLDDNDIR